MSRLNRAHQAPCFCWNGSG